MERNCHRENYTAFPPPPHTLSLVPTNQGLFLLWRRDHDDEAEDRSERGAMQRKPQIRRLKIVCVVCLCDCDYTTVQATRHQKISSVTSFYERKLSDPLQFLLKRAKYFELNGN